MSKRIIIAVLMVGIMAASNSKVFAQAEAGVPSLIIPPGARANGMGEAYVALAQDATAAWWNPGGLAFVKNRQLAFMHTKLVPDLASDVYYEFLGYSSEISGVGTFSISVVYLTYGESIATNDQGEQRGTFDSWEGSAVASFAIPVSDNFGLGMSMKFIHVDYAPDEFTTERQSGSGSSVALDAGAMLTDDESGFSMGIAVTNVGPDISFVDREQSDPLPFTLRTGLAYRLMDDEVNNVIVALDIEQSLVWLSDKDINRARSEIYHIGGEYRYVNLLSGRMGYIIDEDGDFNAPTYGLGFIYKDKLSLDYANVPQAQQLERVHRWSIYFTF
jgi:hypothetical protein